MRAAFADEQHELTALLRNAIGKTSPTLFAIVAPANIEFPELRQRTVGLRPGAVAQFVFP
jgi:hypothetical protein